MSWSAARWPSSTIGRLDRTCRKAPLACGWPKNPTGPGRLAARCSPPLRTIDFQWGNMSRISLSALAAGTLVLAALASPAAAQAPAAEHNDFSKAENWLCWPGRADACSGDNTSTVITTEGKATKESWKPDPKAPIDCFYVYPTVSND